MEQEKFESVLNYFQDLGISLPTEVRNAIEDVFHENDNIGNVSCYHREEADLFEQEVNPVNIVDILNDGHSIGNTTNIWTYYGDIEYALYEEILLKGTQGDKNVVLEPISRVGKPENTAHLGDKKDFAVVLRETVSWDTYTSQDVSRGNVLMIYCPYSDPNETENIEPEMDDEFESIYAKIREED